MSKDLILRWAVLALMGATVVVAPFSTLNVSPLRLDGFSAPPPAYGPVSPSAPVAPNAPVVPAAPVPTFESEFRAALKYSGARFELLSDDGVTRVYAVDNPNLFWNYAEMPNFGTWKVTAVDRDAGTVSLVKQ